MFSCGLVHTQHQLGGIPDPWDIVAEGFVLSDAAVEIGDAQSMTVAPIVLASRHRLGS